MNCAPLKFFVEALTPDATVSGGRASRLNNVLRLGPNPIGFVALSEEKERDFSLLPLCEDTTRKQLPESQEDIYHQTLNQHLGLLHLQNGEK